MRLVPTPPVDSRGQEEIVRVQPGRGIQFVIRSRDWCGVETHYYGGHTIVCLGDNGCKACSAGMVPRWQGFIYISGFRDEDMRLLAFTPPVAQDLSHLNMDATGLLGLEVKLVRRNQRRNSGILTEIFGRRQGLRAIPEERLFHRVTVIFGQYKKTQQN